MREKQQIMYKGAPIRLSADFSAETWRPEESVTIYLKCWKGRTYNQEYSTQQGSHSDLRKKWKALQTRTAKRIQHHQTSFTTNAKGTYLGRKEKATTRNKKIMTGKSHQ